MVQAPRTDEGTREPSPCMYITEGRGHEYNPVPKTSLLDT